MKEAWTDDRLDDLTGHRDWGLVQIDYRFERLETELRNLRLEMHRRFDSMQRMMLTMMASMLVGFVGILATRLSGETPGRGGASCTFSAPRTSDGPDDRRKS